MSMELAFHINYFKIKCELIKFLYVSRNFDLDEIDRNTFALGDVFM
jgi:hypothetical protein